MSLADVETTEVLSCDEVAIIFSFLSHKDIMRARVCTSWRQAAKKTLVMSGFNIGSVRSYNAIRAMSTALPKLQKIRITNIDEGHKFSDGENPDKARARRTANYITHDINVIAGFTQLRSLVICPRLTPYSSNPPLNGSYPLLFNFRMLRNLRMAGCGIKWDLEMLSALPCLKKLYCWGNAQLTGNLISLRPLKDNLAEVYIRQCSEVEGSFMALADFPRLRKLELFRTRVEGDIRDIRGHDFPVIKILDLPSTVQGGHEYKFQRISDVPSFMQALRLLLQRTPTLFKQHRIDDVHHYKGLNWRLSEDSPDWYSDLEFVQREWDLLLDKNHCEKLPPSPPFDLQLIHSGSRLGWTWYGYRHGFCEDGQYKQSSCEINWLDPESEQSESSGRFNETCIVDLQTIQKHVDFYKGYHEPPNESEYFRLYYEEFETNFG